MEKREKELIRRLKPSGKLLSVGCADNPVLHKALSEISTSLVGVDLNKTKLAAFKKEGYDVRYANAEKLRLGKKFDTILAGEIIEHLDRPGDMMKALEAHLEPGGRLFLTTPNLNSLFLIMIVLVLNKTQDATHVVYYDKKSLLAFLERYSGFTVRTVFFVPPSIKGLGGIFQWPVFFLATLLANIGFVFSKRLFGSYLCVELVKKGAKKKVKAKKKSK